MTPPTSDFVLPPLTYPRTDEVKRAEQEQIARTYQDMVERQRGERDGVVVTPVEVVDYQIRASLALLREHYGCGWGDERVQVTDPFGGTGIYCARLMQTAGLTPDELDDLFHHRMTVIEIDPQAARIAALNLARVYAEEAQRFPRSSPVHCEDTFTIGEEAE